MEDYAKYLMEDYGLEFYQNLYSILKNARNVNNLLISNEVIREKAGADWPLILEYIMRRDLAMRFDNGLQFKNDYCLILCLADCRKRLLRYQAQEDASKLDKKAKEKDIKYGAIGIVISICSGLVSLISLLKSFHVF